MTTATDDMIRTTFEDLHCEVYDLTRRTLLDGEYNHRDTREAYANFVRGWRACEEANPQTAWLRTRQGT